MVNLESRTAYESIYIKLPALRRKVLHAVNDMHFATVKEVVGKTGLERLTVGARLTELKQAGLLEPTPTVREGCRVLRVSDEGRNVLRFSIPVTEEVA